MKISTSFLGIVLILSGSESVSVEQDLTMTYSEKKTLDKFKDIVTERLPHDYMKEDIYLIRWLRARDFRIKDAETMLMENLAWRKENNMDEIHNEDFSDIKKQFKYWIDGDDKEGRPILMLDVGEWDIRRGILAGQSNRIRRLIDKVIDEINIKLRDMRSQGKNVTQYYNIFDMEGYNIVQQGCPLCIALSIRALTTFESYYPGNIHKIILINTPSVFQNVLEIIKPLMSPATRNIFFVYGRDKKESQKVLFQDVDKNELSVDLGGNRILPPI